MEREIRFDGNGIITLREGVVICIEGDKFKVVSSDRKEVVHFDKEGKIVNNLPGKVESNKDTDFGCLKYFEKMGKKERKTVKLWLRIQKPKTQEEVETLNIIRTSVNEIHFGYYISKQGASISDEGLYFAEDVESCDNSTREEYLEKAKKFAPEYKSDLASLHELYYWLAYKVASGEMALTEINQVFEYMNKNIVVLRGL